MKKIVLLSTVAIALTACSPKVHHQGKIVEQAEIDQIKAGHHRKEDVAQILGSPTMSAMFKDDRWYYFSKVTQTTAFMKPVASEQNIYVIEFDKTGVVREVKHLGLEDSKKVAYVNRETPTTGHDTSVFQQLFGNFGRIARSDKMDK